ncbi:MAG: 4Fe-4S binding protein [Candidatus Bathyarchaeia archaeon]
MRGICCDILGNHLDPGKEWYKAKNASGGEWIPAFVEYIDPERCIGCGLCLKVCMGGCYEMRSIKPREISVAMSGRERTVKVKKQAFVVNPEGCYGDCHCHKICPVDGGAMVCKPKLLEDGKAK